MSYKIPDLITEYVSNLSDEDLKFVHMRLDQNFTGDQADVLKFLQKDEDVDIWLKTVKNYKEFYNYLDALFETVDAEGNSRE